MSVVSVSSCACILIEHGLGLVFDFERGEYSVQRRQEDGGTEVLCLGQVPRREHAALHLYCTKYGFRLDCKKNAIDLSSFPCLVRAGLPDETKAIHRSVGIVLLPAGGRIPEALR